MSGWSILRIAWAWDPSVVLGCCALALGYLAVVRFRPVPQAPWFFAGVGVLLFALVSPLDVLGDRYLFSVHMVQHLLLLLVVPPLLLRGLPVDPLRRLLRRPLLHRVERGLTHPLVAWLLAAGTLWVWHVPTLYGAALASEPIHIGQHLTFLVTATIFWWRICVPLPERRLAPMLTLPYLFTAGLSNAVLGALLTFAPAGLYPAYGHPVDLLGILPTLRGAWGLSPAVDQQLGGLLMWVPGGLVYLGALLAVVIHWYQTADDELPEPLGSPIHTEEWHVA